MKTVARARPVPGRKSSLAVVAMLLSSCAYTPNLQSSYQFERHPGVFVEVWWQYSYDGVAYTVTNLVNRSNQDKCAWTDASASRLLRPGETWQLSQVQSPGNVGVSNVVPMDPNCVNAKREHG